MRPLSLPTKSFIGECGRGILAGSISGLDIAMPTSLSMGGAHLPAILALEHCTSLPSNSEVNKCHNTRGLLVLLTNLTLIHFHRPDLPSHLPQQLTPIHPSSCSLLHFSVSTLLRPQTLSASALQPAIKQHNAYTVPHHWSTLVPGHLSLNKSSTILSKAG